MWRTNCTDIMSKMHKHCPALHNHISTCPDVVLWNEQANQTGSVPPITCHSVPEYSVRHATTLMQVSASYAHKALLRTLQRWREGSASVSIMQWHAGAMRAERLCSVPTLWHFKQANTQRDNQCVRLLSKVGESKGQSARARAALSSRVPRR